MMLCLDRRLHPRHAAQARAFHAIYHCWWGGEGRDGPPPRLYLFTTCAIPSNRVRPPHPTRRDKLPGPGHAPLVARLEAAARGVAEAAMDAAADVAAGLLRPEALRRGSFVHETNSKARVLQVGARGAVVVVVPGAPRDGEGG